jgi:hypothetical protein
MMDEGRNDELEWKLAKVMDEFRRQERTMKQMATDMDIPFSTMRAYIVRLLRRGWLEDGVGSTAKLRVYRAVPEAGYQAPAKRDELVAALFGNGPAEMTRDKYLVVGGLSLSM